jgi:hypothetical protein
MNADFMAKKPDFKALPLSGASIFVLANENASKEGEAVCEAIQAFGGTCVENVREATHVLWVSTNTQKELSSTTRDTLHECQAYSIPVVGTSWLEQISGLAVYEHWSEVDVGLHVPAIEVHRDDATASNLENWRMEEAGWNVLPARFNIDQRRDEASSLGASISETYALLTDEKPDRMEQEALDRAMELSMLDWALVVRLESKEEEAHLHELLGVNKDATPSEIKAAYRRRALETHPDKGGKAGEFESVARAYRSLLQCKHEEMDKAPQIKSTAHWDSELRDHRSLVNELYQNHGADLVSNVAQQNFALKELGLVPKDAGASNYNEKKELIRNSCFYLSLAASYLDGIGALSDDAATDVALIGETALDLKRTVEAAVVRAHPEWAASGKVGEEVQAFSDFLVYVLDSPTILSDWSVCVFDDSSGFCEVYRGTHYPESDQDWARANTLTIRYVPGHYQPLLPCGKLRPTLDDLLQTLDKVGVLYVVTDGTA